MFYNFMYFIYNLASKKMKVLHIILIKKIPPIQEFSNQPTNSIYFYSDFIWWIVGLIWERWYCKTIEKDTDFSLRTAYCTVLDVSLFPIVSFFWFVCASMRAFVWILFRKKWVLEGRFFPLCHFLKIEKWCRWVWISIRTFEFLHFSNFLIG